MDIEEKKIELLYKSIEDTQQTIRFLDTKASLSVVLLGIFAAMIGAGISDFSKYFWNMGTSIQALIILLIIVFISTTVFAIISAILSVYPKSNPSDYISGSVKSNNVFYINAKLDSNNKLCTTSDDLKNQFISIDNIGKLIDELLIELLKLAYIRDNKLNYVRKVKICIILLIVLSPILILLHFVGESYYLPKDKSTSSSNLQCTCALQSCLPKCMSYLPPLQPKLVEKPATKNRP